MSFTAVGPSKELSPVCLASCLNIGQGHGVGVGPVGVGVGVGVRVGVGVGAVDVGAGVTAPIAYKFRS